MCYYVDETQYKRAGMADTKGVEMKSRQNPMIHKLRLVAGFALIGSVAAGVVLGWADLSFDPRAVGASLGAVAGAIKVFHLF